MYVAILSVLGFSLAAPWIERTGRRSGWLLALLPLAFMVYFGTLLPRIAAGEAIAVAVPWVPSLEIDFSFYIDGLGLFMALVVSGIGTLVVIYAGGYLAGHRQLGRFYTFILLFMGAMLGVVLADNLILLFIFWELTSLFSYLLIGFKHDKEKSRKAALQALLVTGAGGLALLAGLVMLALMGGSWELSALLADPQAIHSHALYLPALVLILLGAFTKSAQFPFHFWLPSAMAAPTPVSAYLHSATMVKAGIYLLARLAPIMGGTAVWQTTLIVVGLATALVGAWLSWQQTDLKRILAYSTIGALGKLVFLVGIGTETALKTAVLFLLVHSLYKGALFMSAGAIEHETGTRDVTKLGGLARLMPFTLLAVTLAAFSQSGIPPLLGFISKELVYETTLFAPMWATPLTALAVTVNVLLVLSAAVVLVRPFFTPSPASLSRTVHEAPPSMWLGPLLLGGLALLFGVAPGLLGSSIVGPATSSIAGEVVETKLVLWKGVNMMLILSIVTVAAGVLLYLLYRPLQRLAHGLDTTVSRVGPAQWYQWGLDGLLAVASRQTQLLQNGYLRYYLLFVVVTAVGLAGYALFGRAALVWPPSTQTIGFHEVLIALLILAGAFMAVRARSRLAAVAALGVVGYGIALFYVLFSAPDLAMTQFSIETLTVILFVLVLYRLPRFASLTSRRERGRDAVIALAVGGLMSVLVLAISAVVAGSRLTDYFAASSVPLAKGRNIVNVILVDFRGMDTLAEITVLAVAAIGVYALMKSRRETAADQQEEES